MAYCEKHPCPNYAFKEFKFCLGHLPLKEKRNLSVEFDDFITDQIKSEHFKFEGYIFPHPYVFNGTNFRSANFINTHFEGELEFRNCSFIDLFTLRGAHFSTNVTFENCSFRDIVNLNNVISNEHLHFDTSTFKGSILCANAEINTLEFFGSKIEAGAFHPRSSSFNALKFSHTNISANFNIDNCNFKHEGLIIADSSFSNARIDIKRSKFDKTKARIERSNLSSTFNFTDNELLDSAVTFTESNFQALLSFDSNKLINGSIAFKDLRFSEGFLSITSNSFRGDFSLSNISFASDFTFCRNTLCGVFRFSYLRFQPSAYCLISELEFAEAGLNDQKGVLEISHTRFNPLQTTFSLINPESWNIRNKATISFQYCTIKDVQFHQCRMDFFGFHTTFCEEARFVECEWGVLPDYIIKTPTLRFGKVEMRQIKRIKYSRRNVIYEDQLLNISLDNSDSNKTLVNSYNVSKNLYRRLKNSLDNSHDYLGAGWFYYNKCEMERQEARISIRIAKRFDKFGSIIKYWTYTLYKTISGYGEKPGWSAIWFLLALSFFSLLHLLNGFKVQEIRRINYDLFGDGHLILWDDIIQALFFSLTHISPVRSYIAFDKNHYSLTSGDYLSIFISLANSIVLIALLGFTLIGIQRQFKRF